MREKLMELLDEYYGNCRDIDHKEEIVDFIENNTDEIIKIIKEGD